jgi:hypothetical protein
MDAVDRVYEDSIGAVHGFIKPRSTRVVDLKICGRDLIMVNCFLLSNLSRPLRGG